ADANMIVLSLRARQELPADHKQWIESWLTRRDQRKSALVALIASTEELPAEKSGIVGYLQSVARLGHMDLFTHFFGANDPPAHLSAEEITQKASVITPLLDEILQRPSSIPRWGINE